MRSTFVALYSAYCSSVRSMPRYCLSLAACNSPPSLASTSEFRLRCLATCAWHGMNAYVSLGTTRKRAAVSASHTDSRTRARRDRVRRNLELVHLISAVSSLPSARWRNRTAELLRVRGRALPAPASLVLACRTHHFALAVATRGVSPQCTSFVICTAKLS